MRLTWPKWMHDTVWNVSLIAYAEALLTFAAVWAALFILYRLLDKAVHVLRSKNGESHVPLVEKLVKAVIPSLFPLFGFLLGLRHISLDHTVAKFLGGFMVLLAVFQAVQLLQVLVYYGIGLLNIGDGVGDLKSRNLRKNLAAISNGLLWIASSLFLLDNYGVNISTFVAGLGVGGIAVALAAQTILGDVFSSFILSIDKPFDVGDSISVDDMSGTIEHIGLKTTRVRSVGGELLIFANSDMTKSRIRNYRRMQERRVLFPLRVALGTTHEKLKLLPGLLRDIVERAPNARFERAHLIAIGPDSLDFEIVYWVLSSDFTLYRDIHQAINMRVLENFAELGVDLAFPEQVIRLRQMPAANARHVDAEAPI